MCFLQRSCGGEPLSPRQIMVLFSLLVLENNKNRQIDCLFRTCMSFLVWNGRIFLRLLLQQQFYIRFETGCFTHSRRTKLMIAVNDLIFEQFRWFKRSTNHESLKVTHWNKHLSFFIWTNFGNGTTKLFLTILGNRIVPINNNIELNSKEIGLH